MNLIVILSYKGNRFNIMNHPSPEWIDWNTFELKDDWDLDINIRFVGLKLRVPRIMRNSFGGRYVEQRFFN